MSTIVSRVPNYAYRQSCTLNSSNLFGYSWIYSNSIRRNTSAATATPGITITINNRITTVRPTSTVLQACEAAGVDVPRFCYHEKLSVAGNCRRCLVEIQKSPKPVVACARPVAKGRVIYTDTPLVRKAREAVLEFLLINHPLDCPICDQGGECDLQDEALSYGSDRGRYYEFKRSIEDKECGPIVKTIRTRCIHCTRCVRFSAEVAGLETLGSFGRGEDTEIGTYIHSFIRTELSGNLVDLCPVGALTSKPYAFQARSWELQRTDSVDFFDALCSDISVHTRGQTSVQPSGLPSKVSGKDEILRVLPRNNGLYSENWISDRTRYAFDGLKYSRALTPQVFEKGRVVTQSWIEFLSQFFSSAIFAHQGVTSSIESSETNLGVDPRLRGFVVGSQANLQRVYALSTFAKLNGSSFVAQGDHSVNLEVDAPEFFGFNRTVQSIVTGGDAADLTKSFSSAILIGTNLRFEASILNTRLRREQRRRAVFYASFGVYSPLRYRQAHQGNSLRTFVALLENRLPLVKSLRGLGDTTAANTALFVGVESFRRKQGHLLQTFAHVLAKRFLTKTAKGERLGFVHSNVATLAFAHLGLSLNKKFPSLSQEATAVKTTPYLFSIQHKLSSRFVAQWSQPKGTPESVTQWTNPWVISAGTHKGALQLPYNQLLPLNSLYERSGHLLSLDGHYRKHQKVVSSTGGRRSLESLLSALCRRQGVDAWSRWTEGLARFASELGTSTFSVAGDTAKPIAATFNSIPPLFDVHGLSARISNGVSRVSRFANKSVTHSVLVSLVPFHPTVRNFYVQDPVSAHSLTRGECSLFLGRELNFVRE